MAKKPLCNAMNPIIGPYFVNNGSKYKIGCKRPAGHPRSVPEFNSPFVLHGDKRFMWGVRADPTSGAIVGFTVGKRVYNASIGVK